MATDYLILFPAKETSIEHGTKYASEGACTALSDASDETFIAAQYDRSESTEFTYISNFEMGTKELPQSFRINVTSCVLSFRSIALYHATGSHDLTFYVNSTEISTVSFADATAELSGSTYEVFSTQRSEIAEIVNAINNHLTSNDYSTFPEITFKLVSKVACTSRTEMVEYDDAEISEIQLRVSYETEDESSILHKKVYLRPVADISVEHSLNPSDSESAYFLLNEEIADDSTTCIECREQSGQESTRASSFIMSGVSISKNIKITGFKFVYRYRFYYGTAASGSSATDIITVTLGDTSVSAVCMLEETTSTYATLEITSFDNSDAFLVELNNRILNYSGELPEVTVILSTALSCGENSKSAEANYSVTQMYLELDYELTNIGIHLKSNGSWLAATQAFQKVNGTWVEITAEECKEILRSI